MTVLHNLLNEQLITVQDPDGRKTQASLPDIFAMLEENQVESFPLLRPHQSAPWTCLLTQLAALALEESGETLPPLDPEEPWTMVGRHEPEKWAQLLRALTPGYPEDEPWCLVVSDVTKPAFLQPPSSTEASAEKCFDKVDLTPDNLDLTITRKAHDLKPGLIAVPRIEEWLFAIVSLQTNAGFLGAENYGIARQNGGHGKRICSSLGSSRTIGGRWGRNVRVILDHIDDLYSELYEAENPLRLLWLLPWDGEKGSSIFVGDLHPLFVEVARRIRCVEKDGGLCVTRGGTKDWRVAAEDFHGALNDPWTPLIDDEGDVKAYGGDMSYRGLQKVLCFSHKPLLLQWHQKYDGSKNQLVLFEGLMKGKGKTEGVAFRALPVSSAVRRLFSSPDLTKENEIASAMLNLVETAENKVLKVALATSAQARRPSFNGAIEWNGPDVDDWIPTVIREMDKEVDDLFFPALWNELERGAGARDDSDKTWTDRLRELVEKYFELGMKTLSLGSEMNLKGIAQGRNRLFGLMKNLLPVAPCLKEGENEHGA